MRKTIWIAAGHIVHTKRTKCSRIHGHNWKIIISIGGVPQSDGMIADFIDIKKVVAELDHKMMLPDHLVIGEDDNIYSFKVFGKDYVLPKEDCVLLDIPAVTAEHLAQWIGRQIREQFGTDVYRVIVFETPSSSVEYIGPRWR